MSSYNLKSREARKQLFYATMRKLQDLEAVMRIFEKDNLAPLKPKYVIRPRDVIEAFSDF